MKKPNFDIFLEIKKKHKTKDFLRLNNLIQFYKQKLNRIEPERPKNIFENFSCVTTQNYQESIHQIQFNSRNNYEKIQSTLLNNKSLIIRTYCLLIYTKRNVDVIVPSKLIETDSCLKWTAHCHAEA